MPRYQYTKLHEVDARGGLSQENIDKRPGFATGGYTPTRAGRFTILSIEKHVSGGRWIYSTVPWGTPMKIEPDAVYIKQYSVWKKLSATNPDWLKLYKSERALADAIQYEYDKMKDGFGAPKPDTWVFNDFGHISVKYYRDKNHNGVFDRKTDELMSDFIHTTPPDEAATAKINREKLADNINLSHSHGCIHMKPNDIDRLIRSGYVRRGITIEVHPYSAVANVPISFLSNAGSGPHELHFFPQKSTDIGKTDGKGKLVVYKVTKLS